MMKLYDPFVPKELHNRVLSQLTSSTVAWSFPGNGDRDNADISKSCFIRGVYDSDRNIVNLQGVETLVEVLNYWIETNKDWFQFEEVNRCIINFYTAGQNTGWHIDHHSTNIFSLLYYVNDADGGTEFEDKKIPHKENSGVFFKSDLRHSPITSTSPRRLSVNWLIAGSIKKS